MFNIHKISLINFRAYSGTQEFDFPAADGLYFFTGENNAALGSNGAGKSTLLDAIVWALYGRTTRGLKAAEVISWGAATCQVSLELTVGEDRFTVKRSQKPNNLFLDSKPLDQAELEKHIRLNYQSFLYSVISAQFGTSFLALSPSEKLALFSDIQNLDYWLTKSEEAADKVKELDKKLSAMNAHLVATESVIAFLEANIKSSTTHSLSFENNKRIRIDSKKLELNRVTDSAISLDEKLADISVDNQNKLTQAEGKLDVLLRNISEHSREHATILEQIRSLDEQLQNLKTLGSSCPTCFQPTDVSLIHKHEKRLSVIKNPLIAQGTAVKEDIEMVKKSIVREKATINRLVNELNDIKDKKNEVRLLEAKILRLEGELVSLKNEINPWKDLILQESSRLTYTRSKNILDIRAKEVIEAELEAAGYWPKGFKRIRLFLIERAFRTLEIEVNNSLAQLGMPDWQITFDIERENKSGGMTKGFVVFVKSPANNEPVRWENWSGGETQRLQLAGNLGLANLIMQRAGLINTVEFYDEPSTHLSPQGMMDLANMLHERAINEGKKIWIVDHTTVTNFGEFEGIITVRKSENGSVITYNGN